MLEIIIEGIIYLVVEIIFQGIIMNFIKLMHFLGILIVKLGTLNKKSVKELREEYKDFNFPYFLGFGLLIGIIIYIYQF